MPKYNNKIVIIFLFFWQFVNAQLGPTAITDVDTAEINTLLIVAAPGVLSNDTGPDAGNLTVTSFLFNGSSYNAGQTGTQDAGALTLKADGSFSFDPATDYTGDVPFIEYTISNGTLTSSAVLLLTVEKTTNLLEIAYLFSCNQGFTVDNEYQIRYAMGLKNKSTAKDYHATNLINKIDLKNNLEATYGAGCFEIDDLIISTSNEQDFINDPYPLEFDSDAINPDFLNGTSSTVFSTEAINNSTLYPRQFIHIEFCVTIKPFCNGRTAPTKSGDGIDFTTSLNVTSTTDDHSKELVLKDFHTTEAILTGGLFIPAEKTSVNPDGTYNFTSTVIFKNEGTARAKNINFNMGLYDFINNKITFQEIMVSQISGPAVNINTAYDGGEKTLLLGANNSLDPGKEIIIEVTLIIEPFSSSANYSFYQTTISQTQGDTDGFDETLPVNKLTYSYVLWEDALGKHLDRYYPVTSATTAVSSRAQCSCESSFVLEFSFLSSLTNNTIISAVDEAPNGILEHEEITFQLTLTNTSPFVQIKDLQLKNNLKTPCNTNFVLENRPFIESSTASTNPTLNGNYNGITDANIFDGNTGLLLPNESITVQFTILLKEDCSSSYTSVFSATDPLNNIVESSSSVNINIAADTDADGISNANDIDDDNDGIPDTDEYDGENPLDDSDNDFIPNYRDPDFGIDANQDGIVDIFDFDNDGVPNHFDLDSDNDGILDIVEANNANKDTDKNGRTNDTVGENGLDNSLENNDTFTAVISYTMPNTDATGHFNFLDIDADADGIVDHIEAQTTDSYIPPSNVVDARGIDTAFPNGIAPIDTDNDAIFDYIDTNSDNDVRTDQIEAWDIDSDGIAEKTPLNSDVDTDGLDDAYDKDITAVNPTNSQTPSSFPNIDNADTPERDWREMMAIVVLINPVAMPEGQDLVFTISLVGKNNNAIPVQSTSAIDINFSTVNGTATTDQYNEATAPYDYNSASLTISIPPLNESGKLTIQSLEDNIFELDELFTLNGTITSNNTSTKEIKETGTILNNDNPPSITMNNSIANEGVALAHTITISHPSSTPIQIAVVTSDGTAINSDDYIAVIQDFSIAGTVDPNQANLQTTPFLIPTLIDNTNETDEEFLNVIGTVRSTNVSNQDLVKTGTIIDIDPYPNIYVDNQTVVEGNPLVFTIRLLNPDLEPLKNYLPIDLEVETISETARASEDYQSVFTTISIPAFSVESTPQEVITIDDRLNEDTETMLLKVTDTSLSSLKFASGTGFIKDNDFPNLFSPNSDGKSDVFQIAGIKEFPDFKLLIIDRWGSEVYNYSNNGRTNPIWWDGTYNGNPVIEGVYFYTLEYNDGITTPKRSFIQLIR